MYCAERHSTDIAL